jgi:hypothetical protein
VSQSPTVITGSCVPAVSRRSTRIERSVPLIILGKNRMGEPFMERTVAVSLNKHGCRYASRHDYGIGTWVTLQVVGLISPEEKPSTVKAVVRTVYPPASSRELQQVGVELEMPSNVWGIVQPPSDWLKPDAPGTSAPEQAKELAPEDEAPVEKESADEAENKPAPKLAEVTAFPSRPAPEATKSPEVRRVVVTPDGLISALQGKFQHEAEKAVNAALDRQLDSVVREALGSIESARRDSVKEVRELAQKKKEVKKKEAADLWKEDSPSDIPAPWKAEIEKHQLRTEQLAQRLEQQVAELKRELADAKRYADKIIKERPLPAVQWNEALAQANAEFERTTTQVMERRYERLHGDVQVVTQEALLKLNARFAEAQALVQSAVSSSLEELRRDTESHLSMMLAETKELSKSALASLNAESRAHCDAQLQAVQGEISRFGECATEQFQSRMKAFLYSCLVAAVGAVDEHAHLTLKGFKAGAVPDEDGAIASAVNEAETSGDIAGEESNATTPNSH